VSDVMGQVGNVEERSVRWIEEKSRLFSWILRGIDFSEKPRWKL
jgi:hypothetical protein